MTERRFPIRFSSLLGLAAIVAVVVVAAGIVPFRQILDQREAVSLAERQLAAIEEENRLLEDQITALKTPQEVERLAREQFGLVRPGEIGYVAVTPEGSQPVVLPDPATFPDTEEPWWRDVWNFLTGGDVDPDG